MIEQANHIKNMLRKEYSRSLRFSELLLRLLTYLFLQNELQAAHSAKGHFKRGVSLFEMNAFDSAISYWKQVTGLDPHCINAYFNIGIAYLLKEDIEKANDYFREVLRLDPYDSEARTLLKHSFWYLTP
jgi:tetratricopeptide (TPR) repeat protein